MRISNLSPNQKKKIRIRAMVETNYRDILVDGFDSQLSAELF